MGPMHIMFILQGNYICYTLIPKHILVFHLPLHLAHSAWQILEYKQAPMQTKLHSARFLHFCTHFVLSVDVPNYTN